MIGLRSISLLFLGFSVFQNGGLSLIGLGSFQLPGTGITIKERSARTPVTNRPREGERYPKKEIQLAYYRESWENIQIKPEWEARIETRAQQIIANKPIYLKVVKGTDVPWQFVGVLHYRESTLSLSDNLHNGQPLDMVTTIVPKGYGPFKNFEESARHVLFTLKGIDEVKEWSEAEFCRQTELYNGTGYWTKRKPSPYVFSGTYHYQKGKYTSDGAAGYNPEVKDEQAGTCTLLYAMGTKGEGL